MLDLLKYSLKGLKNRKLRSLLTILSVFISIGAITALISFGNGITVYVEGIAQSMGDDKLIIQPRGTGLGPPSSDSNVRLDKTDLRIVEKSNGIKEATGMYMASAEVEFDDKKKYVYAIGSDFREHKELIEEVYALEILEGNKLSGREKSKVILGYNYLLDDKIFSKPVKLRDKITVNGKEMKVAGFFQEVGNPIDDSNIYMNNQALEELFDTNNYQFIVARSSPGYDPTSVTETVAQNLRNHRGQSKGNEDFFVQTFEQVIATFTSILNTITAVVLLIALISMFVAAVNIANTMYTSILERTKDIGVFKAIGSKNKHILLIFLIEATFLSFIGGVFGIAAGYLISYKAGQLIANSGYGFFSPVFSLNLVIGSLLFAMFVGILSGILPAYRASKLNPIDALRYE
ncbi:MAG: ABC transporter permease [Nanoarchaeota archaeon]|nr:ABC transporter permease [Nanoarchaeota archaeon]